MISPRYLLPLAALLLLALVPTVLHSYMDDREQDHRRTALIPQELAGYHARPTGRAASWGAQAFGSHDWTERLYVRGSDALRLSVIRSYDAKALYHHPELAVAYGQPFVGVRLEHLGEIRLPTFILESATGKVSAFYALLYGDEFIEEPLWFQVKMAGRLMLQRRKPTTLFFALVERPRPEPTAVTGNQADLLTAAVDAFLRQVPQAASR